MCLPPGPSVRSFMSRAPLRPEILPPPAVPRMSSAPRGWPGPACRAWATEPGLLRTSLAPGVGGGRPVDRGHLAFSSEAGSLRPLLRGRGQGSRKRADSKRVKSASDRPEGKLWAGPAAPGSPAGRTPSQEDRLSSEERPLDLEAKAEGRSDPREELNRMTVLAADDPPFAPRLNRTAVGLHMTLETTLVGGLQDELQHFRVLADRGARDLRDLILEQPVVHVRDRRRPSNAGQQSQCEEHPYRALRSRHRPQGMACGQQALPQLHRGMPRLRLRADLLAELLKPDGLAILMAFRPVTKGTGVQTDRFIVSGQGFGGAPSGIQEVSEVQVPLGILGVAPDRLSEGREGLLRPPRGQQGQAEVAVGLRVAGR